ncbi:hypothetical protein [uncultured Methanolobus sp.]|uniref:hypothetical protein n=1 Tax=uncultured Methanolobus sp. TaxID=218300 RepID=UPI002AAB4B98|nr:hypothetical protein [uncultured Methanolobus sp.]
MKVENKTLTKEIEMKTIRDLEHVSDIRISWKECFKLCFAFAIVIATIFLLFAVYMFIFNNYLS